MKATALMILAGIMAIILVGCTTEKPKDSPANLNNSNNDQGAVQVVKEFAAALAKNDVEKALSFYDDSVFKMEGINSTTVRNLEKDRLQSKDVPTFSKGEITIKSTKQIVNVEFTIGEEIRNLSLVETPQGWRIIGSMMIQ